MKEVDVRGLSCPEPLMIVSRELQSEKQLKVLVNEAHTVANIKRFCEGKSIPVEVKEVGYEYELLIG